MSRREVIQTYLKAMERGDLKATLACFSEDGVAISPTYGEMAIAPFYEKLFGDTVSAVVTVNAIYGAVDQPDRWAAHFGYVWTRRNQSVTDTHIVDLFEFQPQSDLISRITIVFDTASGQRKAAP